VLGGDHGWKGNPRLWRAHGHGQWGETSAEPRRKKKTAPAFTLNCKSTPENGQTSKGKKKPSENC